MKFLNNQTNKTIIVVTGASRGIGLALCKLLASQNGFFIILTSRNSDSGQEQARLLSNSLSEVQFEYLDVSQHEHLPDQVASLLSKVGSIDVLVNNAGIYLDSADLDEFPSFLEVTGTILEQTFDTNVYGPILLTQLLLPHINDNGLVINISSESGKINTSSDRGGHIAYRTSKTALNSFTSALGSNFEGRGIKIISMCPGWVRSAMGGPSAPRSLEKGASDICNLIINRYQLTSGSFYYNFVQQKF